jgi:CDP-diacylglycerol--serine O-phosphatidyltransferase
MGLVQAAVVVTPAVRAVAGALPAWIGEGFAFALLFLATGYLLLGPWLYWGDETRRREADVDRL